jgi:peptide/nickel transport system permease protein
VRWALKIGALFAVVIIVSMLTYLMVDLLPGNPAEVIAGQNAGNKADVEAIAKQYHLTGPLPNRYARWAGGVLHGNFGQSLEQNPEPVSAKLKRTLPNTVQLLLLAELLAFALSVPIGVYSGYRANGKFDKVATGTTFFFLAIPSFVLGIVLIILLNNGLHLLKPQFVPLNQGVVASLKSSIMPVLCLAAGIVPIYARLLRTDMIATLQEDFILNARAKGLKPSYILFRHALRPSCFSLLTVAGIGLGTAIGGSIIVEQIFSVTGVGVLLVNSISSRDIITVQAVVFVISVTYVVANFIVDLLYSALDPRIRRA